MSITRILVEVDPSVKQEVDRYASRLKQTHSSRVWNTGTTASALLTSWAHAQQRKRIEKANK